MAALTGGAGWRRALPLYACDLAAANGGATVPATVPATHRSNTLEQLVAVDTNAQGDRMSLKDEVLALYRREVARTGSYLAARQAVITAFKLSPAQVDRMLRAGSAR
jgi:hypothetical protein